MSTDRAMLLRVQEDCYGRVLAHAYFSDIAAVLERKANTAAEIGKLLLSLKGKSGKVGCAIFVQRPIFVPESDNSALRGQIVQAFTVVEHPTINAGGTGTKKSAEEIAIELLALFHGVAINSPNQAFSGLPAGAVVPDDSFEGLNAWEVRLQTFGSPGVSERCGMPLISPDAGAAPQSVTLTSATAGAAIYYTIDGGYPSSANAAATLYSAPISIAAACTLRAAAEKTGLHQSHVAESLFT